MHPRYTVFVVGIDIWCQHRQVKTKLKLMRLHRERNISVGVWGINTSINKWKEESKRKLDF
jgi:hypothetical protein